jgi:hypothetical protein
MVQISCTVTKPGKTINEGYSMITPELLQKNIDFLASDSLKGRNTPSPGLDTAAAFISRVFAKYGVKPVNGSYFQVFSLCSRNLGDSNSFSIKRQGIVTTFTLKSDYTPFEVSGSAEINGELVFAGYGITAPELKYDDYKYIDVKGKIVLIFKHEPRENDSLFKLFNGSEPTRYSNLNEKVLNARKHEAIGVMVVTEPLNNHSMKPKGFPWPALTKTIPADAAPVSFCHEHNEQIPVIHVGEEVIKCLFGSMDSLKAFQRSIDGCLVNRPFSIPDARISLRISIVSKEKYSTKNVVGLIEGTDSILKNEVVVIGAHYDHVGFLEKHKPDTDYIFNGADDNASGTSGVLAIAQAMASMKVKPRRSVLFLLFAGEEKGLYGSGWYVNHPLIPLNKTIAMLNLDMISRNAANKLELIGAKQSHSLERIVKKNNKTTRFMLTSSKISGGSDHWNFYKKDIPVIFFFTGLHKDYHQVTDNPDRIDAQKAARVAQLIFLTAWDLSNSSYYYSSEKGGEEE